MSKTSKTKLKFKIGEEVVIPAKLDKITGVQISSYEKNWIKPKKIVTEVKYETANDLNLFTEDELEVKNPCTHCGREF